MKRRRALGAEPVPGGVHFRVWAPEHSSLAVVIDEIETPLSPEAGGYFSGLVGGAGAGTRYRFRLGEGGDAYPDPASRFQPEGPFGPSEVIDPSSYRWKEEGWPGITLRGSIIYELHVGTFTEEGTYAAAARHLPYLADVGINVIELMPLHEFPGTFGWGYDGVDLWAPLHLYGRPDDLRAFIDEAHAHGIGVILDVVYNHLGPDGAFLAQFSRHYFTDRYLNDWGASINFDGPQCEGTRQFFLENAACWIDEFRFDGLRLDATQSIHDFGERHVIAEIVESARAAAGSRPIIVVGENEPQDAKLLREYGLDALWNDDWHHSAQVAATGHMEAYYSDYRGTAQELISMALSGFLYQGQRYEWQKARRGTPTLDIAPERLITYLQNHDQVANSVSGARLHQTTSPSLARALTALLLLGPQTPMLFQGEEFAASTPFLYFADHKRELAELVAKGRIEFLAQFPSIAASQQRRPTPDPGDRATFERSRLDHRERETHGAALRLHRELIALRRQEPFLSQRSDWLRGAVLGKDALVLRWLTGDARQRLLLVNLGADFHYTPAAEPLLAPPAGCSRWSTLWSSEWPEYGGSGNTEPDTEAGWQLPAESAIVLRGV